MFDFEKPKNPYRKKGKDYNLSENSKLAGADFAYSNTLASRIYRQMKIIQDDSAKYESFLRLKKKLYMVIRNDRQHDLGQLKLGYGNINPLKNFRFSPKTSWQTFFMNYPTTNFDAEKEELCISTPPILAREVDTLPERVRKVILKMHIIKVSIDDENTDRSMVSTGCIPFTFHKGKSNSSSLASTEAFLFNVQLVTRCRAAFMPLIKLTRLGEQTLLA